MRTLPANPCQAKCDWSPTGEEVAEDLVFTCSGCGSEWARHEAWTPRNLDGTIAAAVAAELSR